MNRLALIAATGFLALVLTGCGESGNKQPETGASDSNAAAAQPVAPQQPAEENKSESH